MVQSRHGGLARGIAALVVALAVAIGASPALARDFPDVTTSDWFYASVQWADSNGVMTGYGDGRFGPSDGLTREQEATVLWRCLGNGEKRDQTTLSDVDQAAYYAVPVNWAVASGTMTGYSGTGLFGVGRPLTRQELAVVMVRVCDADLTSTDHSKFSALTDSGQTASWAAPSVAWAVDQGVINGMDNGDGTRSLAPEGTVTRAQMAAVMQNAVTKGLFAIDTSKSQVVTAKASANDYTWSELSRISGEIAAASSEDAAIELARSYNLTTSDGKLNGTQTKSFALTDGTECSAEILGFRHDDKADGSGKAGISWLFENVPKTHSYKDGRSNAGGWQGSSLRSYMDNDLYGLLPDDLRSIVLPVDKETNNAGEANSVSCITTTSDYLWAPSVKEIHGDINVFGGSEGVYNDILSGEGKQYQLYRDNGIDEGIHTGRPESALLRKTGASDYWYLRSPVPYNSFGAYGVNGWGISGENWAAAEYVAGVVPGFSI